MTKPILQIMSLDVGDKRIGVALGESSVRIAVPYRFFEQDEKIFQTLVNSINRNKVDILVVGRPIDQNGHSTEQTKKTEEFVQGLVEALAADRSNREIELASWGESGTSLIAEETLEKVVKVIKKGDIDTEAAAVILQDFMESNEFHKIGQKSFRQKGY